MGKYSYSVSSILSEHDLNEKIDLISLVKNSNNYLELLHILKIFHIDIDLEQLKDSQLTIRMKMIN